MPYTAPPRSPRLAALYHDLAAGNSAALTHFWQEIALHGTPLVEPLANDPGQVLVTLLWQAQGSLSHVVVINGCVGGTELDSLEKRMTQLLDTNLWYKTYPVRHDLRTVYCFSPDDSLERWSAVSDYAARMATWRQDPFNTRTWDDTTFVYSLLELPAAPAQPWVQEQLAVPVGHLVHVQMPSSLLGTDRPVWIYTPPGFVRTGVPYPLLLLFDGWAYQHLIPTPTILNNLWAADQIPPLITVFLNNAAGAREAELGCSVRFCAFLADELIPWVRTHYHVTRDPTQTIVGGASFGGLAAAFTGLQAPHIFGNVLAQSGSFWWRPDGDAEHEWLTRQATVHPRLPLRFYLEAGLYEESVPPTGGPNQLQCNRHFQEALQARGYSVQYAEYAGGHDFVCWRGTLADGLLALIAPSGSPR